MTADKSKPSQPRYRQLAERLMRDIRQGRLAVGERLPGELELVAEHKVSRHTVRESLRVLEDLGLIARQQGLGTVVRARDTEPAYVQTLRSPAELLQYPAASKLRVVETEAVKLRRAEARLLDAPSGSRWTRIGAVRTHVDSGRPICWANIYVIPDYAGVAAKIARSRRPVYELIERHFGERIASVEVDIRAGLMSDGVAERLGVPAGGASLTVIRRYLGHEQRRFEISVTEHPADHFNYSVKLTRGWQSDTGWTEA
ncbi:MAG: GntR family transcriptional regulator [Pseudomonadota bacterium]